MQWENGWKRSPLVGITRKVWTWRPLSLFSLQISSLQWKWQACLWDGYGAASPSWAEVWQAHSLEFRGCFDHSGWRTMSWMKEEETQVWGSGCQDGCSAHTYLPKLALEWEGESWRMLGWDGAWPPPQTVVLSGWQGMNLWGCKFPLQSCPRALAREELSRTWCCTWLLGLCRSRQRDVRALQGGAAPQCRQQGCAACSWDRSKALRFAQPVLIHLVLQHWSAPVDLSGSIHDLSFTVVNISQNRALGVLYPWCSAWRFLLFSWHPWHFCCCLSL